MIFPMTEISPVLAALPESIRPAGDCVKCQAALWRTGGPVDGETALTGHCMALGQSIYDGADKDAPAVLRCSALHPLDS